jgi:hypothetical protein
MWGRSGYVVTVFDADSGRVYKHPHATRKDADIEVASAKRWGFVAWVTPVQEPRVPEEPRHEAAT